MLQRLYLGHAAACESLSPLSSVCLCRRAYRRLSLINSVLWPLPIREHPGGDVHAGRLNRLRLVDRFPFGALRPGLRAAHISQHWTEFTPPLPATPPPHRPFFPTLTPAPARSLLRRTLSPSPLRFLHHLPPSGETAP